MTAETTRAQTLAKQGMETSKSCTNAGKCEVIIQASFFFDGVDRNGLSDPVEKYTNIYKLWQSHVPNEDLKGLHTYYASGLGTPLTVSRGAYLGLAGGFAKDALKDLPADQTKDVAKKTGEKALESAASKSFDLDDLWKSFKNILGDTFSLKNLKGIGKDTLVSAGKESTKHLFPGVRDSEIGKKLMLGVKDRVEQMWEGFERDVKTTSNRQTIKKIEIFVYGADYGAGIARAFCNKLDEKFKDGKYKGAPVEIKLLGLFDAVGYVGHPVERAIFKWIPLLGDAVEVSGDLTIPRSVKKVVHFVAANERGSRLQEIGGGVFKEGANREERIYPGLREDVVGGYPPGVQDRYNELSRVAFADMLDIAKQAGMQVLADADYSPELKAATRLTPLSNGKTARDLVNSYKKVVKTAQEKYPELSAAYNKDQWDDMGMPEKWRTPMLAHRMVYLKWLAAVSYRAEKALNVPTIIAKNFDQYRLDEARYLDKEKVMSTPGGQRNAVSAGVHPNPGVIKAIYQGAQQSRGTFFLSEDGQNLDLLFGCFVHYFDKVFYRTQATLPELIAADLNVSHYLVLRPIDEADDATEKTWTEKIIGTEEERARRSQQNQAYEDASRKGGNLTHY